LRAPGQPLDPATRAVMEPRLGHDFSKVRVYADEKAAESAQAVNAIAYTVGQKVVLGGNRYAPETREGRRLIAHELTHVVQQKGLAREEGGAIHVGPVDSPQEREAEAIGGHAGSEKTRAQTVPGLTTSSLLLQRETPWQRFRRNVLDEYKIDLTIQAPVDIPGIGEPRIGARRNTDGSWTVIVGNEEHIVGTDEISDILREFGRQGQTGSGSASRGPQIPSLPSITDCRPGEFFDFITLRCRREQPAPAQPEREFQLTMPDFSVPRRGLTVLGMENVTIDHFALDSATLPGGSRTQLDRLVTLLNANPDAEVHIDGHTDSSGTETHNRGLSIQRAEAVKRELIRRRVVNPQRFQTQGKGEGSLINPEERSAEERAQNRRVEVWFVLPPGEVAEKFRLRMPEIAPPRLTGE